MKHLVLLLVTFFMILSSPLLAAVSKTITFSGQKSEKVDLSFTTQETRYRDEVVSSTCTRQVPDGVEQVCTQERRYRQECHQVPGRVECHETPSHQECRDTPPRQVCHQTPPQQVCEQGPSRQECHQTPPRQECHQTPPQQVCEQGPSRQECHQTPSRQKCHSEGGGVVCSMENGRRICRNEPPHQVCETIPGQNVCQTVPGQNVCHTVPGQNVCQTVPGQNVCRTVPGQNVCQTVPGQPICQTVPGRRICENIPAQNVCEQVAYYEPVCHNENRYRTESYTCQKTVSVPYKVTINHDADVELFFEESAEQVSAAISVVFENDGLVSLKASSIGQNEVIGFAQKIASDTSSDQDSVKTTSSFKVNLVSKEKLLSPVRSSIEQIDLNREQLSFVMGKTFDPTQLKTVVQLHSPRTLFHKELMIQKELSGTELDLVDLTASTSRATIDFSKFGIEIPKRKFDVTVTLSVVKPEGTLITKGDLVTTQIRTVEKIKVR